MALVLIGIAVGIGGAAAPSRTLTALLFEVSPYDAVSFAAVSAGLLIVALVACWLGGAAIAQRQFCVQGHAGDGTMIECTEQAIAAGVIAIAVCARGCTARGNDDAARTIISLERGALDRWGRGDPQGFFEIMATGETYFDPMTEKRIDGREALKRYIAPFAGRIHIDRVEMIDPSVQHRGDLAVLTFNLVDYGAQIDVRRRSLGPAHPGTLRVGYHLAWTLFAEGNAGGAETLLRQDFASYQRTMPEHWERYRCESLLGAVISAQHRYPEAEPLLLEGVQGLIRLEASIAWFGRFDPDRGLRNSVRLYESWGKTIEAARWRSTLSARSAVHR